MICWYVHQTVSDQDVCSGCARNAYSHKGFRTRLRGDHVFASRSRVTVLDGRETSERGLVYAESACLYGPEVKFPEENE